MIAAIDHPVREAGTHLLRAVVDGTLRAELPLHVRAGAPTLPPMGGLVS